MVIVTHGLTLRLFLMRWFQLTVEEFEAMDNPSNADFVVMERIQNDDGTQHYELSAETREAQPKLIFQRGIQRRSPSWRIPGVWPGKFEPCSMSQALNLKEPISKYACV